ncbi:MAG: hypothetical protein R3F61_20810 [Myxococcota bacterium]
MDAYVFFVSAPRRLRTGGWQFEVASLRLQVHGPYATKSEAEGARQALEARWRARASRVGGSLRVESPVREPALMEQGPVPDRPFEWILEVPRGTPVVGLPWSPGAPEVRKRGDPRDDPPLRLRPGPWKVR